MWTKKKLSREILVLLAVAMVISIFLFAFLENTAFSICYRYMEHIGKASDAYLTEVVRIWIQGVCLLASALFFIIVFLFLLGQKLLYLQEIIGGIEALRTHRMDYMIPVEGDNEFTQLARSINYLSRTEHELRRKDAELTAEREQFIRSIAHDIRTPITSVLAYSELLAGKKDRTEEEVDAYIDLNLRKGRQMKELMERLMENRIRQAEYYENGKLLLHQVVDDWESVLSEEFSVEVDWSGCSEFSGYFDIQEILRVFDNLMTNVRKYADDREPVALRLWVQGNHLSLEQSNAVGPERPGTDSHHLGLETVRRIVTRHGGRMEQECTGGHFRITIQIPVNV